MSSMVIVDVVLLGAGCRPSDGPCSEERASAVRLMALKRFLLQPLRRALQPTAQPTKSNDPRLQENKKPSGRCAGNVSRPLFLGALLVRSIDVGYDRGSAAVRWFAEGVLREWTLPFLRHGETYALGSFTTGTVLLNLYAK